MYNVNCSTYLWTKLVLKRMGELIINYIKNYNKNTVYVTLFLTGFVINYYFD